MEFSNAGVFPESLPRYSDVEYNPLEKDYLRVLRITWLIVFGILWGAFAILLLLAEQTREPVMLAIIGGPLLLLSIFTYLSIVISFRNSGYALRERDILVRRGWLVKRTRIVPMNRVQHVSVQSGPLERNYNLAAVSVCTAGTTTDVSIRGINKETAEQIKEWISSRIHEQ